MIPNSIQDSSSGSESVNPVRPSNASASAARASCEMIPSLTSGSSELIPRTELVASTQLVRICEKQGVGTHMNLLNICLRMFVVVSDFNAAHFLTFSMCVLYRARSRASSRGTLFWTPVDHSRTQCSNCNPDIWDQQSVTCIDREVTIVHTNAIEGRGMGLNLSLYRISSPLSPLKNAFRIQSRSFSFLN